MTDVQHEPHSVAHAPRPPLLALATVCVYAGALVAVSAATFQRRAIAAAV